MNAVPDTQLHDAVTAKRASIQPFAASEKIYVEGSRPDLKVPMRKISQSETPTARGGEVNPPVTVYDTSGPYTDPNVTVDLRMVFLPYGSAGLKSAVIRSSSRAQAQSMVGIDSLILRSVAFASSTSAIHAAPSRVPT